MPCLHPLRAFPTGALTEKGKPVYFVTSHKLDFVTSADFEKRQLPYKYLVVRDFIEVPCGHCVGCRKDAQYRWSFRCMAESLSHPFNYFITLTYSDDLQTSLSKRDLQLFNKRLRKLLPFRFFACGEYGEKNGRPHYHGVYFCDSPIADLRVWSRKGSYTLYNSDDVNKAWGKGFVVIGTLTPSAASYCAKYCLKFDHSTKKGDPPFILMSRRPGLGDAFFSVNQKPGVLFLPSGDGRALKGSLPRYAKCKYSVQNPYKDYVNLKELSSMVASGYRDLDNFRDLVDFLEKNPSRFSL